MFTPSIPEADKHENNYMLASIIGKRAVQLMKGSDQLSECSSDNTVTIAICEYKEDKIAYVKNESVELRPSSKHAEY